MLGMDLGGIDEGMNGFGSRGVKGVDCGAYSYLGLGTD
jgi:hypothetical protein